METKFLEMISEVFEMDDKTVNMDDNFRNYEEWDSLVQLSLIAEIDENYSIVIEDDIFKGLTTLQDLYNEIQKRTNA